MTAEASGERDVLVYMTSWCGDCRNTLRWLDAAGVAYRKIDIDRNAAAARRVMELNRGNRSVPTILVDGEHRLTEPSASELAALFGA